MAEAGDFSPNATLTAEQLSRGLFFYNDTKTPLQATMMENEENAASKLQDKTMEEGET